MPEFGANRSRRAGTHRLEIGKNGAHRSDAPYRRFAQPSARRVEQAADRLGFRELVIKRHCFLCWQNVNVDLPFRQEIECLARDMKALRHSTREDDHFCTVIQQFLHVGNLNAGAVTSSCLAPVPLARTAGKKFCVFVRFGFALDLEPAPGNVINSGRTIAALHCCCHSERSEESRIIITGNEQNGPEIFLPRLRDQDDSVLGIVGSHTVHQ